MVDHAFYIRRGTEALDQAIERFEIATVGNPNPLLASMLAQLKGVRSLNNGRNQLVSKR